MLSLLLLAAGGEASGFTPVTNTYNSGTAATETVPAGATNGTAPGGGGGGSGPDYGSVISGNGARGQIVFFYT